MSKFYSEIAKYYDYIFPLSEATLKFIEEKIGNSPKSILDVAAGSGLYSNALNDDKYNVTAIDLDEKMIENLNAKNKNIDAKVLNMLEIGELGKKFDTIFCIGNSLVHLNDDKEVLKFLKSSYNSLNNSGSLIIQIVNYDRILAKDIKSLPTISNEKAGLTFERNYEYIKKEHKINFNTVLKVNNEAFENDVLLLPIKSEELTNLFKEAGFKDIKLYGNFKKDKYEPLESVPLIITGTKK